MKTESTVRYLAAMQNACQAINQKNLKIPKFRFSYVMLWKVLGRILKS